MNELCILKEAIGGKMVQLMILIYGDQVGGDYCPSSGKTCRKEKKMAKTHVFFFSMLSEEF